MEESPEIKKYLRLAHKKKEPIGKLLKHFTDYEKELSPADKYDDKKMRDFFIDKYDVIEYYPNDILFAPYGPAQVPSVKEVRTLVDKVEMFVDEARKAGKAKDRELFRLGIYLGKVLIGCLTFEYNLIETEGYDAKTTLNPEIIIDPKYRKREGTYIRRWREVFALLVAFLEDFYPDRNKKIPISATIHFLNSEMEDILTGVFVEYKGIWERRFFTIGYREFKNFFRLDDPKVTVSFISQGKEHRKNINPHGPLFGETEKTEEVPRYKII
jgi:hypothetical protein